MSGQQFFYYISSKAGADPVKTIFICAPASCATCYEDVEQFVHDSGWMQQVEEDGSLLIAPIAEQGWAAESQDLLLHLYQVHRNDFRAPSGVSIPGRKGIVWTWEVLIYLVGYSEGAQFVGNFLVAHPGFAAASILVDGEATDFSAAEKPSDHWLVPHPHVGYDLHNKQIPVAVWLMGLSDGSATEQYFREVNKSNQESFCNYGDVLTASSIYTNEQIDGAEIRVSPGLSDSNPQIAKLGIQTFFEHILRWKNGPDGTLASHISKQDFWQDGRYRHHELKFGTNTYHYAVYLPTGINRQKAAGLPLVLSMHGRGEPSWIFCQKNGWERLADETGEFVLMLPDSPYNLWVFDRDAQALLAMMNETITAYGLDETRVYLTGFSNGGLFTNQLATTHPEKFAAVSPWNSPGLAAAVASGLGDFEYASSFATSDWELPFWIYAGDSDNKAPAPTLEELTAVLVANGCKADKFEIWDASHYTPIAAYPQAERFHTQVFTNGQGSVRVGLNIMRDMPHGAIPDEARAAWNFMRRFRRQADSRTVDEI